MSEIGAELRFTPSDETDRLGIEMTSKLDAESKISIQIVRVSDPDQSELGAIAEREKNNKKKEGGGPDHNLNDGKCPSMVGNEIFRTGKLLWGNVFYLLLLLSSHFFCSLLTDERVMRKMAPKRTSELMPKLEEMRQ